jgi:hypothetical protein
LHTKTSYKETSSPDCSMERRLDLNFLVGLEQNRKNFSIRLSSIPTSPTLSSTSSSMYETKQKKDHTIKAHKITQVLFTLNFARVRDCTWHVQQAF